MEKEIYGTFSVNAMKNKLGRRLNQLLETIVKKMLIGQTTILFLQDVM